MFQKCYQRSYSIATLAVGIFFFHSHFSTPLICTNRYKNRVIAKAFHTFSFCENESFAYSFKKMLLPIKYKANYCPEPCRAVLNIFHFLKKLINVLLKGPFFTCIPGTVHPGLIIQCIHFKASIITKAIVMC